MKDKGYDVEWYIAQLKQDIKGLKEAYKEEFIDTKTYMFNDVNEGIIQDHITKILNDTKILKDAWSIFKYINDQNANYLAHDHSYQREYLLNMAAICIIKAFDLKSKKK